MNRTEVVLITLSLAGVAIGFIYAHWVDTDRRERP